MRCGRAVSPAVGVSLKGPRRAEVLLSNDPIFQKIECIDNVNTLSSHVGVDVLYEFNGCRFVWDEIKARVNLSKHGISFEQAVEAFFDPFLRVIDHDDSDNADVRDALLGMTESQPGLFMKLTASRLIFDSTANFLLLQISVSLSHQRLGTREENSL